MGLSTPNETDANVQNPAFIFNPWKDSSVPPYLKSKSSLQPVETTVTMRFSWFSDVSL